MAYGRPDRPTLRELDLNRVIQGPRSIPIRKGKSDVVRFLEHVEIVPGRCWPWKGTARENGLGYFRHPETKTASRAAYLLLVGPLTEEQVVDHLCRNPICVNPDHLEAVSQSTNVRRGLNGRWRRCDELHPKTPSNVATRSDGRKFCRECNRLRNALARARLGPNAP